MSLGQVLFIDDDAALRTATEQALQLAGFTVHTFADAESALAALPAEFDGVVLSDIRMPRIDGLELLSRLLAIDGDTSVVLVTGHGDVAMAVQALHDGACDFLTKPFAIDHLTASLRRAIDRRSLILENRRLRAAMARLESADSLIGDSTAMNALRTAAARVARSDLDVLIEGETGTGKELVARLIHRESPRRGRSFVAVNCAALSEANAEVELFGHAADSVSQTRLAREGLIAAADGGTLLLDEIDSLPLAIQGALLRVLEEREVLPIGANRPRPLDLRVLATTKCDLASAAVDGRFRSDLYFRLAAVRLHVPPLRDRGDDRLLLFAAFLDEARATLVAPDYEPPAATHARLRAHNWPGNVRELRNFAFEAVLGTAPPTAVELTGTRSLGERVAAFEAAVIAQALERHHGRVDAVVDDLGTPRKTLYDKLARHGLKPSSFRRR